jgi:outer membrane protein
MAFFHVAGGSSPAASRCGAFGELCRSIKLIVLVLGTCAMLAVPAAAEPMRAALSSAYRLNPEIDAQRARLRATDEDVQRARSGWAPRIDGEASLGIRNEVSRPGDRSLVRPGELSVQFSQPLFTGFRTFSAVNQAEASVRAGRAELRDVEARILSEAAAAYADVKRDRELVRLAEKFVGTLARELRAAQERRSIGEVTFTDIDQTKSRLTRAKLALNQARGDLRGAEADYLRLVGREPSRAIVAGIVLGKLPKSLSEAVSIAIRENALVVRALYQEQAARHGVARERSELLPRVDLEGGYRRSYNESEDTNRSDTAELIGRLQVPLYRGGDQRARVRQAKHLHVGRLQDVEAARRRASGDLRVAWADLKAAKIKMKLDRDRISFALSALKGVRDEERVGQRTLLDVLNAEEELFQARSSFEQNFRDMVVAHYQVLRAMGRLDSGFLKLAEVQYDPERHYKEVRGEWLTTSIATERKSPVSSLARGARRPQVAGWRTSKRTDAAKGWSTSAVKADAKGFPKTSRQARKRRPARVIAAGKAPATAWRLRGGHLSGDGLVAGLRR